MVRTAKRIVLIGHGHLGMRVAEALLRDPGPHEYVIAGRDPERARRLANLLRQYASAFGESVSVRSVTIDVTDVEQTAATLTRLQPDIVYLSVTRQSWWVTGTLPAELEQRLAPSCVGPWLPVHLTLVHDAMRAIRAAELAATVVNASYPDVTHPVLAKVGLAPDVGIGNIAIPLIGLRLGLAERYDVPIDHVHVRAAFHHYVNFMATRTADPAPAPFHIQAWIGAGDEVREDGVPVDAERVDVDPRTVFEPLTTELKRASGPHCQHVTAATAAVVLRALLDDVTTFTHAPGPLGLPGGYPVKISAGTVGLALPPGLNLQAAVDVNEQGGRYDGIERIDNDGTVHFREENVAPLREHLGYVGAPLPLAEVSARADELTERFAAYAGDAVSV